MTWTASCLKAALPFCRLNPRQSRRAIEAATMTSAATIVAMIVLIAGVGAAAAPSETRSTDNRSG
jgi:hypothetical protein